MKKTQIVSSAAPFAANLREKAANESAFALLAAHRAVKDGRDAGRTVLTP